MSSYNLRENEKSLIDLTDFEIFYTHQGESDKYSFYFEFKIDFYSVYYFTKTLGSRADDFIEDLRNLHKEFQEFIYDALSSHKITYSYSKEDWLKRYFEKDLKLVYDNFLPKQKAFAEKWNLYINCDHGEYK